MKNLKTYAVLAVAGLMLTLSAPSNRALAAALPVTGAEMKTGATPKDGTTPKAAPVMVQAKITLSEAVKTALSANPGAIAVEASLEAEHGKAVYLIKMLSTDRTSFDVAVDAITGAVVDLPANSDVSQADTEGQRDDENHEDQNDEYDDDEDTNDENEDDENTHDENGGVENKQSGVTKKTGEVGNNPEENNQEITLMAAGVKVSLLQAIEAVQASAPGSVAVEASLDSENGIILYTVSMVSADGTSSEVKVDAATGALIMTDLENVEHAD